jgi:hypothetical protein
MSRSAHYLPQSKGRYSARPVLTCLRGRAGASYNEDGPLQMAAPDPDGVVPTMNLLDRSFKEHNMAATWNGSMAANPVDRSQVIHLRAVSARHASVSGCRAVLAVA